MDKRAHVLDTVAAALADGTISRSDLQELLKQNSTGISDAKTKNISASRLSAVEVMFYIAGIVLFGAIIALVAQVWDEGAVIRIALSAGIGLLLWAAALTLIIRPRTSDAQQGMTNALLLAGSLSIISGGFIIASEYVPYDDFRFYVTSLTLILLGLIHIGFGWQIRHVLLILLGILLSVAAFPMFIFGLLEGSGVQLFIYCLVVALTGGLLAYATRIVSRVTAVDNTISRIFDPLSAFITLMSLYVASYDESTGLLWLLVLVLGIIGLFYLSIVTQNKLLLGNGSLFLVIAIITISFRYFSDNVAISLLISAAGLLGTALMAASINRRYIR